MAAEIPARDPRGRLFGKVAVVVGAGATAPGWGNGNAVAALFAREGATVHAIDVSLEAAERTRAVIEEIGGICSAMRADATKPADMQAAMDACVERHGRIDVLHNNVGGGRLGSAAGTSLEDWQEVLDRNLNAAFLATRYALPHMVRQKGGTIVHIGSVAGLAFYELPYTAYSVAKAGLMQFSRNVALQHVDDGIRSNCLVLGNVDTAEVRRRFTQRFGPDKVELGIRTMASKVPMKRVASVWEIARAAVFLASDESSYITGTELVIDGGVSVPRLPSFERLLPG